MDALVVFGILIGLDIIARLIDIGIGLQNRHIYKENVETLRDSLSIKREDARVWRERHDRLLVEYNKSTNALSDLLDLKGDAYVFQGGSFRLLPNNWKEKLKDVGTEVT